jgi:hypothetical protein
MHFDGQAGRYSCSSGNPRLALRLAPRHSCTGLSDINRSLNSLASMPLTLLGAPLQTLPLLADHHLACLLSTPLPIKMHFAFLLAVLLVYQLLNLFSRRVQQIPHHPSKLLVIHRWPLLGLFRRDVDHLALEL